MMGKKMTKMEERATISLRQYDGVVDPFLMVALWSLRCRLIGCCLRSGVQAAA